MLDRPISMKGKFFIGRKRLRQFNGLQLVAHVKRALMQRANVLLNYDMLQILTIGKGFLPPSSPLIGMCQFTHKYRLDFPKHIPGVIVSCTTVHNEL